MQGRGERQEGIAIVGVTGDDLVPLGDHLALVVLVTVGLRLARRRTRLTVQQLFQCCNVPTVRRLPDEILDLALGQVAPDVHLGRVPNVLDAWLREDVSVVDYIIFDVPAPSGVLLQARYRA